MPPELPPTYYLDNVHTLFTHVEQLYSDLLDPDTLDFLQRFDSLGTDARLLCVRLLNRSGDCFRLSKLDYAEIDSIEAAIDELRQQGFIEYNAPLEAETLLSLFTLNELRDTIGEFPDLAAGARLRRGELEAYLLEHAGESFMTCLQQRDDWLLLYHRDEYQLCQMLFFGNLNQSMTDFVLSDLGLNRFEDYRIDPDHRPYRSREEIL